MTTASSTLRMLLPAVLATCVAIGLTGCHAIDFGDQRLQEPLLPEMQVPDELTPVSLPAYRIEPPDVLQIEMVKMVPLPPYRMGAYDVLQVRVVGTFLDQPIDNVYLIDGEGYVNLGAAYGKVRVAGMTIEETKDAIDQHLRQLLAEPVVSVQLARASDTQPVTGQYLVAPDGTINLRKYGRVHVAGKTVAEARQAVEKQLAHYFDSPKASVEVLAYRSKVYYVITDGAELGDSVQIVPVTGKETVLDAISTVGGLSQLSSTDVWIARPAPPGYGCDQIMPIDWRAITKGGSTATNYQILPGDRVFIAADKTSALTNTIVKVTGPVERLLGVMGLGLSTVRAGQTLGRQSSRRFFDGSF